MIRFYSLFVTDDKLLASPYIRRFNLFHDLTLHLGKEEVVHFLLQTPITEKQQQNLNVIFDPLSFGLSKVEVKSFEHQTLITVTLTPKELGSMKLGFTFPQTEHENDSHLKKVPSPFTSVPCLSFGSRYLTNKRKAGLSRRKKVSAK
ncbi:hypothetical protein KC865_03850 [Candidatus Kaiserbacteria bacterium]|nr:hypothetical protein [Candidatus Kaiserbacteria bacterium]USN92257.1 MAG: hypothetical protein H6782_00310 [Candidatus Nomurabacteria bacterium]